MQFNNLPNGTIFKINGVPYMVKVGDNRAKMLRTGNVVIFPYVTIAEAGWPYRDLILPFKLYRDEIRK